MSAVTVGLVGAGAWARAMHAPLHAAGQETTLAGVWSRRAEPARALAAAHGVPAFSRFEELLEHCEAVDFAVSPGAQAALAPRAAAAGKALMLEKPLGTNLSEARAVADAVRAAAVPTVVVLTKRFLPRTREFLAEARELRAQGPLRGLSGCYLHGGFLSAGFAAAAGTWRAEPFGALLDLGPHLLDLADAAAGPIAAVRADGDPARYLTITTAHADGATGQLALSGSVALEGVRTRLRLYSEHGELHYSTAELDHEICWPAARAELAAAVRRGAAVTVDVDRALAVQEILEAVRTAHGTGRWEEVRHG